MEEWLRNHKWCLTLPLRHPIRFSYAVVSPKYKVLVRRLNDKGIQYGKEDIKERNAVVFAVAILPDF